VENNQLFSNRTVERKKQNNISIKPFLFHVVAEDILYFQFPCFDVVLLVKGGSLAEPTR
jgi:hypothetical protein